MVVGITVFDSFASDRIMIWEVLNTNFEHESLISESFCSRQYFLFIKDIQEFHSVFFYFFLFYFY